MIVQMYKEWLNIKKHIVIPVFVPHKGCPFDCIFCNQKTISGQVKEASEQEIRNNIESYLSGAGDAFVEIGFYGGSFTGIPKEEQIRYLEIGNSYIQSGRVKELRLSTRPDYINEEILELLKKYGVKTIELGVQSLHDDVLRITCRGHSSEVVTHSSHLIKKYGFTLGIQTMIGLPGDTRDKAIETAKRVIELKPDIVRIYPTLVITNTYLEKLYHSGKYCPLSLEDAVDLSAELLDMYQANNINVIRIGLQPTDNISESGEVVAGPFHAAFRQLVESRNILKKMCRYIESNSLNDCKNIAISCSPRLVSDVVGQKRINIELLKQKYGFICVKIVQDNSQKLFSISKI